LRTIAYAEIEAFACENLLARMESGQLDAAPIWSDLKSFPWAEFSGLVDILSGGYPCQPFSAAGLRKGTDDPRHLWPYIASGIRLLRPKLCFFENVEGHISLGLREVVGELEELGYETTWGIFSAAECGAPHQRKRVFILAHLRGEGLEGYNHWNGSSILPASGPADTWASCQRDVWPSRPGQPQHAWEPSRVVGNAEGRMSGQSSTGDWRESFRGAGEAAESLGNTKVLDGTGQARRQRQAQVGRASATQHNGQTESTLGGDFDGASSGVDYAQLCVSCDNRTDELRLLGNGVVPATAALAFRTLLDDIEPSVHH
jgi:DNA (cytosine-5)-methyltransferase 1